MTTLTFRNYTFSPITHHCKIWLTSAQLAKALEYADPKAVTGLYNNNKDEFTVCMSKVVDSTTLGKSRNKTRIFSLRGAHLVAMFARTPVAKEFRKWVLDILDKEVDNPQPRPEATEFLTDNDTRNLAHLVWSMANGFRFERAWTQGIWYALRHATGIASPQHFEVNQIAIIAEECRRIYGMTNTLKSAIFDAEKQVIRRLLRHKDDVETVLREMQQLLESSTHEHDSVMTQSLERWQQANVNRFLQRN
ncbi:BRO-N domain-containing protein [Candidatus Arsenophonus triatominarum]|uniref:BRO-N domain-containing protein n=1 Tax=Candidatus Arsenophonus triatominarum TaxID=57911 RepID=UPI0007C50820|nr:BRO family protein [Candidatus Arsenophonus triatominarum]